MLKRSASVAALMLLMVLGLWGQTKTFQVRVDFPFQDVNAGTFTVGKAGVTWTAKTPSGELKGSKDWADIPGWACTGRNSGFALNLIADDLTKPTPRDFLATFRFKDQHELSAVVEYFRDHIPTKLREDKGGCRPGSN